MQGLGISSVTSMQILAICKKCNAVKILQAEKKKFSYFMCIYSYSIKLGTSPICPQGSYSKYDTDCMTRELCLNIQEGQEIVLSSKVSCISYRTHLLCTQMNTGGSFPTGKAVASRS